MRFVILFVFMIAVAYGSVHDALMNEARQHMTEVPDICCSAARSVNCIIASYYTQQTSDVIETSTTALEYEMNRHEFPIEVKTQINAAAMAESEEIITFAVVITPSTSDGDIWVVAIQGSNPCTIEYVHVHITAQIKQQYNYVPERRCHHCWGFFKCCHNDWVFRPRGLTPGELISVENFMVATGFQHIVGESTRSSRAISPQLANILTAVIGSDTDKWAAWKHTSEIVEHTTHDGFDYFEGHIAFEHLHGVADNNLDKLAKQLRERFDIPGPYHDDFNYIVQNVKLGADDEWIEMSLLFSHGSGGECKYINIIARHNGTSTDWIIARIRVKFHLAPDVFIMRTSKTAIGLFHKTHDTVEYHPASLRQEDIEAIMTFFEIVSFREILNKIA